MEHEGLDVFHAATAMDAVNLKDIKGNACVL